MNTFEILDSPIAYHRCFVTITGSVTGAVMLSQAVYWTNRTTDPEGWFFKTRDEWEEETGLSRTEQETARRNLCALGFWKEERRGVPAKMFFRIEKEALTAILRGSPTRRRETCQLDGGKAAIKTAEKPPTIKRKITSETTAIPSSLENIEGFAEEWQSFKDHRKALKKKMTPHAEELTLDKLSLWPEKAIAVLRECIERGWQSFKWDWPEIAKLTGGPINLPGAGKSEPNRTGKDIRKKYGVGGC